MTNEEAKKLLLNNSDFEKGKSGEWIFKNGKYRCTACGEKAIYVYSGMSNIPKAILTDFCPNCGAPMAEKALEILRKREGEKVRRNERNRRNLDESTSILHRRKV